MNEYIKKINTIDVAINVYNYYRNIIDNMHGAGILTQQTEYGHIIKCPMYVFIGTLYMPDCDMNGAGILYQYDRVVVALFKNNIAEKGLIFLNNSTYKGEIALRYINNNPIYVQHGFGIFKQGNSDFKGMYENGCPINGCIRYTDSKFSYNGDVSSNYQAHGDGTLIENGTVVVGKFENNNIIAIEYTYTLETLEDVVLRRT